MKWQLSIRLCLTLAAVLPSACVLRPAKTFDEMYGDMLRGVSEESLRSIWGDPVEEVRRDDGSLRLAFEFKRNAPRRCSVVYELVADKVVSMQREGPGCRVYY